MKNSNKLTLISLFSGCGGLDIGLEKAGFETMAAVENNHWACTSLRLNRRISRQGISALRRFIDFAKSSTAYQWVDDAYFDNLLELCNLRASDGLFLSNCAVIEDDIRNVTCQRLLRAARTDRSQVDLIAGGPPCQSFSMSGQRKSTTEDRGRLFCEFARMVAGVKPRSFLLENVKGMVSAKSDIVTCRCAKCKHTFMPSFRAIISSDNSKIGSELLHHCPECGHGLCHIESFLEAQRGGAIRVVENEFSLLGYKTSYRVLNSADYGAAQNRERVIMVGFLDHDINFHYPERTHCAKGETPLLVSIGSMTEMPTIRDVIGDLPENRKTMKSKDAVLWLRNVVRPHAEPVTWSLDGSAPTCGAHQGAKLAIAPNGVPEEQIRRQQWHTTGNRLGHYEPLKVPYVFLSDNSLLRLQTFPRSWVIAGTRMERAFQIGNAVPPILANVVGRKIMESLKSGSATAAEVVLRSSRRKRKALL